MSVPTRYFRLVDSLNSFTIVRNYRAATCVCKSTESKTPRISRLSMRIHGSVSTKKHPRACNSHFAVEPGKEVVHRVRNSFSFSKGGVLAHMHNGLAHLRLRDWIPPTSERMLHSITVIVAIRNGAANAKSYYFFRVLAFPEFGI